MADEFSSVYPRDGNYLQTTASESGSSSLLWSRREWATQEKALLVVNNKG
ncbi:UNVERIFIED_CONTAM: hypothetical protein FKN15_014060 [Acipenser sinensis]